MTKEYYLESIKKALGDRAVLGVLGLLLFSGLIYTLIIGFSIQPRDVQVYIRYTSFGEAHFYKNPWQYTMLFAVFGSVVALLHASLVLKLNSLERRTAALAIGWIGIAILFIATVYALSIMRLAFR